MNACIRVWTRGQPERAPILSPVCHIAGLAGVFGQKNQSGLCKTQQAVTGMELPGMELYASTVAL